MKYRTKLYIAFIGTAIISTSVGMSIAYVQIKKFFFTELQNDVRSIAASTVAAIDVNTLKTVENDTDQNLKNYHIIHQQLTQIRDANRRKDVYVKYLYIMARNKHDPNKFFYLVDAEDDPTKPGFVPPRESADEVYGANLIPHLHEIYSPDFFTTDAWGSWLSGYAPVLDSQGNYIATVGVNLYASSINAKLKQILDLQILAFVSGIIMALVAANLLSRYGTRALHVLNDGVKAIYHGDLTRRINIGTDDEFSELAQEINTMAQGLQERDRLMLNFSRYVSRHIMESIVKTEEPLKLEGERRKVTVLFSDIRQFTQLTEKLHPEQVVALLNEYFAVMVEIIFHNNGMLDKFLGDGMMVEFGVPLEDDEQELHAVRTAIEMRRELKSLCAKWQAEGKPVIDIGIGIHTGVAVVGNIGSEKRVEYTAIGDVVNVSSRLEQMTKELHAPVVISEATVQAIGHKDWFKSIGPVQIRGRSDSINVYTLNEEIPEA